MDQVVRSMLFNNTQDFKIRMVKTFMRGIFSKVLNQLNIAMEDLLQF